MRMQTGKLPKDIVLSLSVRGTIPLQLAARLCARFYRPTSTSMLRNMQIIAAKCDSQPNRKRGGSREAERERCM